MTFEELLNQFEPKIAAAFREAIDDIKSAVVLARVVERLERGDINGAIRALQIEGDAFSALELALGETFNAGGINAVAALPKVTDPQGNRVIWRFGVRNPEAERLLRLQSSLLVTRITEDQREGIRYALKQGLSQGRNPRSTALDVVGRVSKVTGRREGGLIGLTQRQIEFVERARLNLLSGDPEAMKQYLQLKTRDKRFDRTVIAAIKAEKPVSAEAVSDIIGRLNDKNLQLRGEMLARTETMTALGTARDEAMRQQIEAGKVAIDDVQKIWRSASDSRVRHTHRSLSGQSVGMSGSFTSSSGATLRYPGDPSAPASEIVGCRCWLQYKVDYMGSVVRQFRAEAA